jgi:pimeloyl-ACP methyl ester carboxylesterase
MEQFQGPMQPFPGLERWARQVQLPSSGFDLHLYDTAGDVRSTVLLLHGLGDEADTWRHVLPRIHDAHRVIAPDLPGFGRSDKGKRNYTIPFFVKTILELLDTLAVDRAVLVGHSAGAVIAQSFALENAKRVERLVLVGGSLVAQETRVSPGLLAFLVPGVGEWLYTRLRKDPQAAYRTLEPYYYRLDELPQADRDFLYQRVNERVWSDGQRRGFFSTLRSLAAWVPSQQKSLPARLSGWNVPTTIIWGENDQVNPVGGAHALKRLLPAARLVTAPEAGHNIHQEKPEIIVEAIMPGGIAAG